MVEDDLKITEKENAVIQRLEKKTELTQQDGRKFVCSKRDKAITGVFCGELHLKLLCSGHLQKDLLKER